MIGEVIGGKFSLLSDRVTINRKDNHLILENVEFESDGTVKRFENRFTDNDMMPI